MKRLGAELFINAGIKAIGALIGIYQLWWITTVPTAQQSNVFLVGGSIVAILSLFLGFGIFAALQKAFTNKEESEGYRSRVWTTLWYFRLITVLLGIVAALVVGIVYPTIGSLFLVALFLQSALVLIDYNYFAVFASHGDVWKFSITDLVGKLVSFFFMMSWFWGLKLFDDPVLHFVVAQILSASLALALDAWVNRNRVQWSVFDSSLLKSLFPQLSLIALSSLAIALSQNSQPLILQYFNATTLEVNSFSVAMILIAQGTIVLGALNTQIASNIKQVITHQREASERVGYFWKNVLVYGVFLLVAYTALLLVLPYLVSTVVGANADRGLVVGLVGILGLLLFSNTFTGLLSFLTIFYHQEKAQLTTSIVLLVLSFGIFWLVVPTFGVFGMAWAMVGLAVVEIGFFRLPLALKMLRKKEMSS